MPQWLPWAHGIVLAITLVFWIAFLSNAQPLSYVYKRDFLGVYVGTRAVVAGQSAQLYDFSLQRQLTDAAIAPYHRANLLPYVYPAYVGLLLAPLGKLNLTSAFFVWTGVNFLAALWLGRRLMRYKLLFRGQRITLLVAFLAWVPLQLTLSHGQMGLFCALAVGEAAVALNGGLQWKAGCWLALGLLKPQLIALPLLALVLWRSWRALASFSAILFILLAASFAKLGFWIPAYLHFLAKFNRGAKEVSLYPAAMQNWRGLASALFGSRSAMAFGLQVALSVGSLGAVLLICRSGVSRKRLGTPEHLHARFAIVVLLGILVSPHLYFHDWIVGVPALAVLLLVATEWTRVNGRQWPGSALLWLVACSPFVAFALQFGVWPEASHIQLVPWYMGLMTAVAIVALRRVENLSAGGGGGPVIAPPDEQAKSRRRPNCRRRLNQNEPEATPVRLATRTRDRRGNIWRDVP